MRSVQVFIIFLMSMSVNTLHAQNSRSERIKAVFNSYQNTQQKDVLPSAKVRRGFYKKYISHQISAQCEFNNTCSSFFNEAIKKQGIKGVLLGFDRLARCGSSSNTYNFLPSLIVNSDQILIDTFDFYD